MGLEMATGEPVVYDFDDKLNVINKTKLGKQLSTCVRTDREANNLLATCLSLIKDKLSELSNDHGDRGMGTI